jgi:pyruvate ferredoxin oxidoreductase alpha subunit
LTSGRAITRASLQDVFEKAGRNALERLTFLDLKHDVIHREIERLESTRMSGPTAENILRDLGAVADHIG